MYIANAKYVYNLMQFQAFALYSYNTLILYYLKDRQCKYYTMYHHYLYCKDTILNSIKYKHTIKMYMVLLKIVRMHYEGPLYNANNIVLN